MRKFTITLLLLCLNFGVQAQENEPEEREELRSISLKKDNIDYALKGHKKGAAQAQAQLYREVQKILKHHV